MFPAPSPNSQAIYQQLANGGATPGTLDFHRTAMNAAAARKDNNHKAANKSTSQPQEKRAPVVSMDHSNQQPQPQQPPQQPQATFGPHDNDAANGLYLLAQAGNGTQSNNQFAIPNPPNGNAVNNDQGRPQDTSPNMIKRVGTSGSIGDSLSGSARAVSEMSEVSDSGDQSRPATRARGKRASAGKAGGPANGRRKAEETPAKQPSAKKAKANDHQNMDMNMDGMDSDEETNIKEEQYHENGKKMTDEEKRKNFLERNRFVFHHLTDSRMLTNTQGGGAEMPAA